MKSRLHLIVGIMAISFFCFAVYMACFSSKQPTRILNMVPHTQALPASVTTGSIAANGAAVIAGYANTGTVGVSISGAAWSGTLGFQFSIDGVVWTTVSLTPVGGGAAVSSTTANGNWTGNSGIPGNVFFQVVATAWTSGTATITINTSTASNSSVTATVSGTSTPTAGTTGGATPYHLLAANTNNATSLKASAGQIYGYQVFNRNTSTTYYLKFYNKASAPAPASDTPILTIPIPAAVSASQPSGVSFSGPPVGGAFSTGIAFAITAGVADNDNTAVTNANDVVVDIFYNCAPPVPLFAWLLARLRRRKPNEKDWERMLAV